MSLDPDPPAEPVAFERTASPAGDMDPETFRAAAHRVVDLIADYLATVERSPRVPADRAGLHRPAVPGPPPEHGEPLDAILADVDRLVLPNATHWQHPGFFAYFATSASGPGILGELLTAALGQNPMLWRTSPIGTELEGVVVGWLRQALGLPDAFDGLLTDTASTSHAHRARRRARGRGPRRRGRGLAGRGTPRAARLRLRARRTARSRRRA